MKDKNDFLDSPKKWIIRPCTLKDLRELYGVSYKVLKTHITAHENEIGKRIGLYYMTNQVITIIKTFGPPPNVEVVIPSGIKI